MQLFPFSAKQRPLEQSPGPVVKKLCGQCHPLACGCYICEAYPLLCLSCLFVPHLCLGRFGLRRGQNAASFLGSFQGWTWGRKGCYKLLLPTSKDILFSTLPFSSALSVLSHTRHMIPVQKMRSRMRGKNGKEFFLLTSSPGFLAFCSIRIRGFVFFLLIPVWKHFTLSSIESSIETAKWAKALPRSSLRPRIK